MSVSQRVGPPDLWPRQPHPSGALYGELPLTLPRTRSNSHIVVIVSRENGVTSYEVRRRVDDEPHCCQIDTSSEWILAGGVRVEKKRSDKPRAKVGGMSVAVLVAQQRPSTDPERIYVDHADGNSLNDTFANLHWVTPAFNSWNRPRKERAEYFGVYMTGQTKNCISVIFRDVHQGSYDNCETAARVYDLVVRLAYKDQVEKTPHMLNNLPRHDEHVIKVESRADGVDIYRVDHYYLVVFGNNVQSKHATLEWTQDAAERFISDQKWEQLRIWLNRRFRRQNLEIRNAITRNADNVAFMPMKPSKNTSVEVLMDDSTWLDLMAAEVTLLCGYNKRPTFRLDGKTEFLNRFLRRDVIDHVNHNVLDHRLANLEVRDRSANSQNARKGSSALMGITPTKAGGWIVLTKAKGEDRMPSKTFAAGDLENAIELYDLTALYQHGPCALINNPDNLDEYLKALKEDKTKEKVKDFLAGRRQKKSMYEGVGGNFTDARDEVRSAIYADFMKLKSKGTEWRLNFEFMRPWYLYYLPELNLDNARVILDKAYRVMGGDDFVRESREARTESPRGSPSSKRKRD
ncbi:hypothetical protein EX895_005088 [Sporisorium graminicola]|uniref:Uncharacterized protein n=1 Tax=Sporisorium graminicola TaxID=280036 RepID=A0A4U7KPU0_9BASI|nr:hypothetical protein EX895_005088 [Sporisorium graminicola]TKY86263.1 hypothetical protein EX895_005088 [Sporisorium graminicola]